MKIKINKNIYNLTSYRVDIYFLTKRASIFIFMITALILNFQHMSLIFLSLILLMSNYDDLE